MLEELSVQEPGIGVFKASGKLTDADYQQFVPRLEALIHEYGKISVLLELDDFHGWEPKAAWDDFTLGLAHPQDFERIAIVGDKAWEHWIALLAKPFTHAQVRYFPLSDRDAALDWLAENLLSAINQQSSDQVSYRHVLIAVDFSAASAAVLKRGLAIAARDSARLSLIHVVDGPVFDDENEDLIIPRVSEHTTRQIDLAQTRLQRMLDLAGSPKGDIMVLTGLPKIEIPRYAEQHDADLIVVGSHGHGGLGAMLGSTAGSLLHRAACDVLVVRVRT